MCIILPDFLFISFYKEDFTLKKTLLALSILSAFSGGWAQGAEPLCFYQHRRKN